MQYHVLPFIPTSTLGIESRKVVVTLRQLTNHLLNVSVCILENYKIQSEHQSKRGLHLHQFDKNPPKTYRFLKHLNDHLPLDNPLKLVESHSGEKGKRTAQRSIKSPFEYLQWSSFAKIVYG